MFHFLINLAKPDAEPNIRDLNPYTLPVVAGDRVKVRETHPSVNDADSNVAEHKAKRGNVVGVQTLVTVQFDDGTVAMFDRDELSYRVPGMDKVDSGIPGVELPDSDGGVPGL